VEASTLKCMYICMYICIYMYVCMYIYMYKCMYIHKHYVSTNVCCCGKFFVLASVYMHVNIKLIGRYVTTLARKNDVVTCFTCYMTCYMLHDMLHDMLHVT
jgi:hypothetical protein